MEQELALIKTEDLELLARRSLAADSARAKVVISRRVMEILSRVDESIPVRSAAQALGSLAPIVRLLYRWHEEPEVEGMERARGAINLKLISMTPEQLRNLGELEGVRAEAERNGLSMGSTAERPEQTETSPPAGATAPRQPLQGSPSGSPGTQELAARREAFERARAEHRKASWEKYR